MDHKSTKCVGDLPLQMCIIVDEVKQGSGRIWSLLLSINPGYYGFQKTLHLRNSVNWQSLCNGWLGIFGHVSLWSSDCPLG